MAGESATNDVDEEVYDNDGDERNEAREASAGDRRAIADADQAGQLDISSEAKTARSLHTLEPPTDAARMAHNATHVPFRELVSNLCCESWTKFSAQASCGEQDNGYTAEIPDRLHAHSNSGREHNNLVHKFILMPQAMKIPAAKAAVDKEWEKLEKISCVDITKVRNKQEVIDEARTKGAKVHFASLMDLCHLKNSKAPKIQRSSCTPRRYCKRRFGVLCSIHRATIISITNDGSKSHGYHIQIARVRRTSS